MAHDAGKSLIHIIHVVAIVLELDTLPLESGKLKPGASSLVVGSVSCNGFPFTQSRTQNIHILKIITDQRL